MVGYTIIPQEVKIDNKTLIKNANGEIEVNLDNDTLVYDTTQAKIISKQIRTVNTTLTYTTSSTSAEEISLNVSNFLNQNETILFIDVDFNLMLNAAYSRCAIQIKTAHAIHSNTANLSIVLGTTNSTTYQNMKAKIINLISITGSYTANTYLEGIITDNATNNNLIAMIDDNSIIYFRKTTGCIIENNTLNIRIHKIKL